MNSEPPFLEARRSRTHFHRGGPGKLPVFGVRKFDYLRPQNHETSVRKFGYLRLALVDLCPEI